MERLLGRDFANQIDLLESVKPVIGIETVAYLLPGQRMPHLAVEHLESARIPHLESASGLM